MANIYEMTHIRHGKSLLTERFVAVKKLLFSLSFFFLFFFFFFFFFFNDTIFNKLKVVSHFKISTDIIRAVIVNDNNNGNV